MGSITIQNYLSLLFVSYASMRDEIFYNTAALDIVCSPYLVGKELEDKAFEASKEFLRGRNFDNPIELVILEGGKYYHISDAFESLNGFRPKYMAMDSKRRFEGNWDAVIKNMDLSQLESDQTILIGDTIATGISLHQVLNTLVEYAGRQEIDLGPVHIFTIAGSRDSLERLRMLPLDLIVHFANAEYGLATNGTDLLFENAVFNPKAHDELHERLGPFYKKMKCAVWDWGDRFRNPKEHLKEIKAYFSSVDDTPDWLMKEIDKRL